MVRDSFGESTDSGMEVQAQHGDKNAALVKLLRALAIADNARVTELTPLYESIESEALFELLQHADEHDCIVGVEFVYGEFTVSISESGSIRIHDGSPKIA